jgi:hypothetical protein
MRDSLCNEAERDPGYLRTYHDEFAVHSRRTRTGAFGISRPAVPGDGADYVRWRRRRLWVMPKRDMAARSKAPKAFLNVAASTSSGWTTG